MHILAHVLAGTANKPSRKRRLDLSNCAGHYRSRAGVPGSPHTISLGKGGLVIDGAVIAKPRFKPGEVSWSEKTANRISSGCLHVLANGAMLSGVIVRGASESAAEMEFVALDLADLSFDTTVQRTDLNPNDQGWQAGPPLLLGIRDQDGLKVVIAEIAGTAVNVAPLPPPDGSYSARVEVAIQLGQDFPGGPFGNVPYVVPYASDILVDADGLSFGGTMQATADTNSFPWKGAAPAVPQAMALAAEAVSALDLSLADLMSLTTNGAVDIARDTYNAFTVIGMQDEWRDKIFGLTRPVVSAEAQAVYDANASLFTDHASDAIILHQLASLPSDQGGPSNPISAADKLKLDYFYTNGILGATGYPEVSSHLTQIAWETANPRVRDYASDPTQSWAQNLYDTLTTPQALTTAVMAYLGAGGDLTQVNRHCDMLLALSPERNQFFPIQPNQSQPTPATYASLYHSKVLSALGVTASQTANFPGSADGQAEFSDYIAQWLTQFMQDLATKLKDPDLPKATQAAYSQVEIELQSLSDEQGGFSNLANELVTVASQSPGSPTNPSNLIAKVQNWAANSKLAKGVVNGVQIAVVGYALYTVIGAFSGWNKLSDKDKAQTVINAAELPIKMLNVIADAEVPEVVSKLMSYFGSSSDAISATEQALALNAEQDEWFFNVDLRWMAPGLEDATEESALTFAKIFGGKSGFMKDFGVMVAAATVGFSSYQIYADRNSSAAIKAIDSLQLLANIAVLAGAVLGEDFALGALGPIGIVAGVVLAIVALFVGRPKPESAADSYMDNRGNAYLAALPDPDSTWVDPTPPTEN